MDVLYALISVTIGFIYSSEGLQLEGMWGGALLLQAQVKPVQMATVSPSQRTVIPKNHPLAACLDAWGSPE